MRSTLIMAAPRVFFGTWPDKNGRGETRLTVEQVSHHPPVTAYHIANTSKGVVLRGHSGQKTSFSSGTIIGWAILFSFVTWLTNGLSQ